MVAGIAWELARRTEKHLELGILLDASRALVGILLASADDAAGNSMTVVLVRMTVVGGPVGHLIASGDNFRALVCCSPGIVRAPPMESAPVHLEVKPPEVLLAGIEDRVASLETVDTVHPPLQVEVTVQCCAPSLTGWAAHNTEPLQLEWLALGMSRGFRDMQGWCWIVEETARGECCHSRANYWGRLYGPSAEEAASTCQDSSDHRELHLFGSSPFLTAVAHMVRLVEVDFQRTGFQNKSSRHQPFHRFPETAWRGICSGTASYPVRAHIQECVGYMRLIGALLACGHNTAPPWTVWRGGQGEYLERASIIRPTPTGEIIHTMFAHRFPIAPCKFRPKSPNAFIQFLDLWFS